MRFWRDLGIVSAVLIVVSQVSAQPGVPHVQRPQERIFHEGYSFVIPDEVGWTLIERSSYLLALARSGDGPDETHAIRAGLSSLPPFKTIEDFAHVVREEIVRNTDPQRFKISKIEAAAYAGKTTDCVKSHSVAEDHSVRRRSAATGTMILERLALACPHPSNKNIGVNVEYSQRYNPGKADPRFLEKGMTVLNSIEFTFTRF